MVNVAAFVPLFPMRSPPNMSVVVRNVSLVNVVGTPFPLFLMSSPVTYDLPEVFELVTLQVVEVRVAIVPDVALTLVEVRAPTLNVS
jgi:hypothetical protein